MSKTLLALSISVSFLLSPNFVSAEPNLEKGKALAESCAGCHGENGDSMVPTFPKLAGQHAIYIERQLLAFKNNTRNAPMMAPLAMGLSKDEIEDIAAFYATQKTSTNAKPSIDNLDELLTQGSDLYRNGNLKSKVSACIACHGPFGEGNKPAGFPTLKGQHADYLIKSLTDFKKGARSNVADNMMHMIAKKMTDKEIQAVSHHISLMK